MRGFKKAGIRYQIVMVSEILENLTNEGRQYLDPIVRSQCEHG
jgi:hypothetical protein